MNHSALRREFSELLDLDAPVERLAGGFTFTEGPIWHPRDQYLLFSDMPADVRRRYDERGGVREVMKPSNKCNGMTYDADLGLVVCEHATSSLIRERDGRREILASHFEGKELNSPNDVCVRSDGSIYFSDPWYGRMPVYGVERSRQLGFQGVYRVPPGGGEPQLVVDRNLFEQPNGLCFSPDERLLYVNDTVRALIRVFDVNADGSLGPDRIFASGIRSELEPGVPDGMKCDSAGNIWVTAPGGIWIYSRSGALLGKVRVPELVANLHWGKADWRTLFMCATHSLYAVRTKIGPRVEPFMRSSAPAGAATIGDQCGADGSGTCQHEKRPRPRPVALRAHYPGHAERRGHRRWRLCRLGRAATCPRAERRREHPPPGGSLSSARGDGHPRLVHCRTGRARLHPQRAAVRGSGRLQRDGARNLGRRTGCRSWSRSPATTSSKRCG